MLKAKPVSISGSRIVSAVKKWFTVTTTSSEAILEAKARIKRPHQKWHLTFRILKDRLWNRTTEKHHQFWTENGLCHISAFWSCFSSSLWGTPFPPWGGYTKTLGDTVLWSFSFLMYQHLIEWGSQMFIIQCHYLETEKVFSGKTFRTQIKIAWDWEFKYLTIWIYLKGFNFYSQYRAI